MARGSTPSIAGYDAVLSFRDSMASFQDSMATNLFNSRQKQDARSFSDRMEAWVLSRPISKAIGSASIMSVGLRLPIANPHESTSRPCPADLPSARGAGSFAFEKATEQAKQEAESS